MPKESKLENVKNQALKLKEKATEKVKKFNDYAKENPKKAALFSLGVGVLLGGLAVWAMKKRKKE